MTLPIKTRILEYAIEKDAPFTNQELSDILKVEYNNEKTTSLKNVEKQLDMYNRVAFLSVKDVIEKDGELIVTYQITNSGKEALKYIPGHGNKAF